jgi:3-deoxy-manno-octulosonate cytidylyltransferase (CMP-KDO synthetase)
MPWHRDRFARDQVGALPPGEFLRHIGIYAYRAGFLSTFTQLPPGRLELLEGLEQLRVLEAGHAIQVAVSPVPFPPGVDTEADLERANAIAAAQA